MVNTHSEGLFFLVDVRERSWNPVKGFERPAGAGMVWEARVFPTGRAALGGTKQEAVENAIEILTGELELNGKTPGWYESQLSRLTSSQQQHFVAAGFDTYRRRLPLRRVKFDSLSAEVGTEHSTCN